MFVALAFLGCALSTAHAAFLGTIAAQAVGSSTALSFTGLGAGATTSTLFLTPAGAGIILGGAVLLKGAVLATLAASAANQAARGKRDVLEMNQADLALTAIAANEPAQCYRRLVCELATGQLERTSGDVILKLFSQEVDASSPRFDFVTAAKIGKQLKNVDACEIRYSCPLTGSQINKAFQ